jgi:branched-chain amino acid transport system permease protein
VQDLIQFLLNALSLGSVYALMALGLVIVFGILRLVNFAYGELIMVAGYTWFILQGQAWAMFAIAVAAVFAAALASVLTERIAFRPIRSESLNAMLVTSFAVSTLLQNSALLFVSPRARAVEVPAVMNQNINFAGLRLGAGDLITILVSGVVLAGLALLLRRTTLGSALRAASDDFRMLRLLGVRADMVVAMAFLISGVLAGIVGLLWISRIGSVTPTVGLTPLLIALIAVVVGGMNGLTGSIVGGYLLGALTVGLQLLLPQSVLVFRDAFIFAVVVLVLVFRPQGLVRGRYSAERVG